MADTNTKSVMSLIATSSSRVRDLAIKDGQLIFLRNVGRIALDYKGERVFYNQIVELQTEAERLTLASPLNGYYFCIDSACLWFYQDGWIQITDKPQDIIFIGDEVDFPQLGQMNKLYIASTDGSEHISIWDENSDVYKVVADKTQEVSDEDILSLFN